MRKWKPGGGPNAKNLASWFTVCDEQCAHRQHQTPTIPKSERAALAAECDSTFGEFALVEIDLEGSKTRKPCRLLLFDRLSSAKKYVACSALAG
jgi:hypothetical protein